MERFNWSVFGVECALHFLGGRHGICNHLKIRQGCCVAVETRKLERSCGISHHGDFESLFQQVPQMALDAEAGLHMTEELAFKEFSRD